LKVPVQDVYKAELRLKVNYRKATEAAKRSGVEGLDYFYQHRVHPEDDPAVKDQVASYLSTNGLFNLKRAKVHQFLQESLPAAQVPSERSISAILKDDFKLRFRRYDGAMARYKDPTFDEKRVWACRLLAQFLTDDALVVSIDESHLRSDQASGYRW
jgi:hypothetical protein